MSTDLLPKSAGFYESLAHLLYAVAVVDNNARIEEKRTIKELVDEHWHIESEDLNSKSIIFPVLKRLFSVQYDKELAFLNYKQFFLEHRGLFSEKLKKKIMYSANKIADAFSGRNKSESVLISRLHFLMWK
ncbi:MAG: hypothetical protein HEP71_18570 [Roseivirga sp.]|nr:hypothetical protein [Roseivirga sp.]